MIFRLLQKLSHVTNDDIARMSEIEALMLSFYWSALLIALLVIGVAGLVAVGFAIEKAFSSGLI